MPGLKQIIEKILLEPQQIGKGRAISILTAMDKTIAEIKKLREHGAKNWGQIEALNYVLKALDSDEGKDNRRVE